MSVRCDGVFGRAVVAPGEGFVDDAAERGVGGAIESL